MSKKKKPDSTNTEKYLITYKDQTTEIVEGSFSEAWSYARKTAKTFSVESI